MKARKFKIAAFAGLSVGLIVSATMTFADWHLNPSGLFHDEFGTDWERRR